ncbi:hypothetical protein [Enterobacter ludwigii]
MHKSFESWVLQQYGTRYNLEQDAHGYYAREVVKRMFEVWSHCRGLSVV